MKVITYSALCANLDKTMTKVCQENEPIIVSRRNMGSIVILSLEDFQELNETAYFLRSPTNAKQLQESIEEINSGGGTERRLIS